MRYDENKKLKLHLSIEKVIKRGDSIQFSIEVSIANQSDSSFLLYDFKEIEPGSQDVYLFTQPDMVCGNALFVFDRKGRYPRLGIKDNLVVPYLVSEDSIRNIWKRNQNLVHSYGIVLLKRALFKTIINAKFINSELKPGVYVAYMIYYSGRNVKNVISEETIVEDEQKNKALLYQGYAKSNPVRLIVR